MCVKKMQKDGKDDWQTYKSYLFVSADASSLQGSASSKQHNYTTFQMPATVVMVQYVTSCWPEAHFILDEEVKSGTAPMMELTAAVIAVKMDRTLQL